MKHSDFYIFNEVVDWLWDSKNKFKYPGEFESPDFLGMPKYLSKLLSNLFIEMINCGAYEIHHAPSREELFWWLKIKLFGDIPDNIIPKDIAYSISVKDKRYPKWCEQRTERGWDDSDTWDLDKTIAKFTYPRLKRFIEVNHGYPADFTEKKWKDILDKILHAIDISRKDNLDGEAKEGLELLGKYFNDLWF